MRPYILLTNDDGIASPGLMAAARALAPLGELLIAAPRTQQTGMGRSFPREADTGRIEPVTLPIDSPYRAFAVEGSPAWCVAYAVLELAERRPDLCVAGINYGENLGMTVSCSGTLGAAFEAVSHGIPSLAVSLETDPAAYRSFPSQDWASAEESLALWAGWMLARLEALPANLLNINVPAIPISPARYRITSQSRQNYLDFQKPPARPLSQPFVLRSAPSVDEGTLEPDSDIWAVWKDRIISVTPMTGKAECRWNEGFQTAGLP